MSFAFADIGANFVDLVQQHIPRAGTAGKGDSKVQEFSDRLDQEIKALDSQPGSSSLFRTVSQSGVTDHTKKLEALVETLSQENPSGTETLSKLRDFFLSLSNGDLNSISIDAQGLEDLKEILVKAGFDSDEVDEVMSELLEGTGGGKIGIADLMAGLSELDSENEGDEEEDQTLVESSFLPFLQSILQELGLTPEQVDIVVGQADKGEGGIDLNQIIEDLKALESAASDGGYSFETQAGDDSFVKLLEQMGLKTTGTQGETFSLTLKDFISSLETLKEKMSESGAGETQTLTGQSGTAEDKPFELINSLFKHLEVQTKEAGSDPVFSESQIRDQFKTDLILSKENKTKNPFSTGQANTESKPDFKELESLFKTSLTNEGEKKTGPENFSLKKLVSDQAKEGEKNIDQNLETGIETKTQDSKLSILRTKANIRNLPNHVTQQVSKSLVKAINQGESSLKIQLNPPELGRLVMTIDNTGNSMKVSILTENQSAKDILVGNAGELKTVLTSSGISLDQFDVDMSSNFRQSMADARNPSQGSGGKNRGKNKTLVEGSSAETDSLGPVSAQEGTLHYVA
ncbi:flagellar hook-length control protein FliK [Desulfospira joergensenii]|uniref:flagellar hook-length control protein FliK n=1 Tax=Desulfospira joergensenii TaxID=53329 RepID=UPI0003B61275|nr:flagellar hook-length control protein FliK [Desulfospira joergensenii]